MKHSEKSIISAFQSKLDIGTKNTEKDHQVVIKIKESHLEEVEVSAEEVDYSRDRGRDNFRSRNNFQQISCDICKKNGHLENYCISRENRSAFTTEDSSTKSCRLK